MQWPRSRRGAKKAILAVAASMLLGQHALPGEGTHFLVNTFLCQVVIKG